MNELIWVGQVTGVIMFLAHLAGGVAAIHSIMSNRTAQGAIAWSLSLAFLPLLAVPLYLVTGRNRFAGYVFLRREGDEEIRKNYPNIREAIANVAATPPDDRFLAAAIPLAGLPMTRGNSTELLPTTEEAFEKMFESIERAENYLLVFFFIVRDDSLGDRFQKALASKAREGVRVLFGYDEIGSRKLKQPYLQELRTAGVEVFPFRTSSGIRRLQINFRNHRKILIADGEEAFLGG
ncbi:MAG: cardiolipin synthase, partial [Verrucomicrobiota bacterium]